MEKNDINAELVGSWSVIVGDQDQAMHVWKYTGGFAEMDKGRVIAAKNKVKWLRVFM